MNMTPLLLAGLMACTGVASAAVPPEQADALHAFVDEMVAKHRFDAKSLTSLLDGARFQDDIVRAISRPAEAKPWYEYRPIFVNPTRIEGGVRFWREQEALLRRAEQEYGVAPEIIVAIIGVETRYGGNVGKYRVLDALTTLTFGYPPRAAYFRSELESFLLLARDERIDFNEVKGSYAGAMGLAQFMPSSYRAYAVDFDGDGRRDLWNSPADAIGSVANYLKRHGWQRGGLVTLPVRAVGPAVDSLVAAGMQPSLGPDRLAAGGVVTDTSLPPGSLVSLIRLEGRAGKEYWLGLNNFYSITRYNHSNLYAMAVFQLSREILDLRKAGS
jgi:membrane-bound lytic murein transglycosylase B